MAQNPEGQAVGHPSIYLTLLPLWGQKAERTAVQDWTPQQAVHYHNNSKWLSDSTCTCTSHQL